MIPDDEPWWMVRRLQGDGYGGSSQALPGMQGDGSVAAAESPGMQGDGSVAAAESPARELSPGIAEPTDFRPFGYEW